MRADQRQKKKEGDSTLELSLIQMSDVQEKQVDWLWHPYIPCGKVTIIQGDPGEGKTTFILRVAALLTQGEALPFAPTQQPMNVIYQTAEDGLADTIKPRLLEAGADCKRVLVIDETAQALSMSDERLAAAVQKTGAKLVILDPLQAYLGATVDMHRANEIRPVMKRLGDVAEQYGCAIVLIGHMNKASGTKAAYRGLGSIDFQAAARSVLVVGRLRDQPEIRIVAHAKSSLAPEGQSLAFELNPESGFRWLGHYDISADDLLVGITTQSKTVQGEELLRELLETPVPANEVFRRAEALGISERTVKIAKKNLGIVSEKAGGVWRWKMPE